MNQNYPTMSKSLPPFPHYEMGGRKGGQNLETSRQ